MANKVYINPEDTITFRTTGGTVDFTPTSLIAGDVAYSDIHDFGTGPRPANYKWRGGVKFTTTPVLGETIDVYLATSDDGSTLDGDFGTAAGSATYATTRLANLQLIGVIAVDDVNIAADQIRSGFVDIYSRYGALVWRNSTVDSLSGTAADNWFDLIPTPFETQ